MNTQVILTISMDPNEQKSFEERLKRIADAGIINLRINIKRSNQIYLEQIKKTLDIVKNIYFNRNYNLFLDIPFPGEKCRIIDINTSKKQFNVDDKIYVVWKKNIIKNDYDYVIIEKYFYKYLKQSINKCVFIGDGESRLIIREDLKGIYFEPIDNINLYINKSITIPNCNYKTRGINSFFDEVNYIIDTNPVKCIFLSFVNVSEDVNYFRKKLRSNSVQVISKIESSQSLINIYDIIEASDGLMIARGDLALNVDIMKLFSIQNYLVGAVHTMNKKLVIATDILNTYIFRDIPSRSDIIDFCVMCGYHPTAIVLKGAFQHIDNMEKVLQIKKWINSYNGCNSKRGKIY